LTSIQAKAPSEPAKLPPATIERRVQMMRKRLAEGGEVARGALREVLPSPIWLQPDSSGRFLWACFSDGVGAALFDSPDILASFPVTGKSASVVAGACYRSKQVYYVDSSS